jgi:hypothetical protein
MTKRRIKKKPKRRVKKKLEANVRTEPVNRPPLLGGGGSFSIIPANPFQESMNNTMTAIQQNVNNNVNTGLNQMKTEFELMKTHLQELETQYNTARHTADMLREQQLKNTIDTYAQQMNDRADTMALMHRQLLDTEQMALQSLRNPYMEQPLQQAKPRRNRWKGVLERTLPLGEVLPRNAVRIVKSEGDETDDESEVVPTPPPPAGSSETGQQTETPEQRYKRVLRENPPRKVPYSPPSDIPRRHRDKVKTKPVE